MVEPYKFMVYQRSGKSVVRVGSTVLDVDELKINVPTWAEYNIPDVAQFVIAGEGRVKMHESRNGETVYRRCTIEDS